MSIFAVPAASSVERRSLTFNVTQHLNTIGFRDPVHTHPARLDLVQKLLPCVKAREDASHNEIGIPMDQTVFERMIRAGKLSTEDVLHQTPVDRLEETLALLKQHRPEKDICQALTERIAKAPRDDFNALKSLYFRNCVDRPGKPGDE